MPTPDEPHAEPVHRRTLSTLHACCNDERARYRRTRSSQDSLCCREIVRRAVATPTEETLTALLDITRPTIERHCPLALHAQREDFVQEVQMRLWKRITRNPHPLTISTFAEYLSYVHVTCQSVAVEFGKRNPTLASLDQLRAEQGFEPPDETFTEEVEKRMLLQRQLELLPNARMRSAFHRRFVLHQTPDDIAAALGVPKQVVFRLIEQAIRHLRRNPEVRDMLEV